jgi:hypothetical protein
MRPDNHENGLASSQSATMFRWPLSREVVAEVRFIGKPKPAHLDLLKQYLEVAKTAMQIDEEDQEKSEASPA